MTHLTQAQDKTQKIAELNDRCRWQSGEAVGPCRIMITQGIASLPLEDQVAILVKVRHYDTFSVENDPYGERDFGDFAHNGEKIFWKIDYYDPSLRYGSEDPADPVQTVRVLTIMLAGEY